MRKITSLVQVLGVFALLSSTVSAQTERCGTTEALRQLYAKYPSLAVTDAELLNNSKRTIPSENGTIDETVYTIPIVFHILHEYGYENISDAQVYDQVAILNEDFRKLNADTNQVFPEFSGLIADSRIEFKLASKDPFGNCTNGIEHINSHETNVGDDYSKLNQWSRNKYLNVWVVKSMRPGVAGYAYYPGAVSTFLSYADGINILNDHIGSIGTANENNSRSLTHEIGHWLNLAHTWGSTNDPGVACGDDDVTDTPETKGYESCDTNNAICTPGVKENVQNYMDYSYCSYMFTPGQAERMRTALTASLSQRNELSTANNLAATGTDVLSPPICVPTADFSSDYKYVCVGDQIQFVNHSYGATINQFTWTFSGGTPSTSNDVDPVVTFNSIGWQNVSLTVSNVTGSNTKTIDQMIYVSPSWADYNIPYYEGFEPSTAQKWIIENPENNLAKFQQTSDIGLSGNNCMVLNNFSMLFADTFYFPRLGGNKDAIISPSINLESIDNNGAVMRFDYTYASRDTDDSLNIDELLRVSYSSNCGKNWNLKTILTGLPLAVGGIEDFYYIAETSSDFWGTVEIPITPAMQHPSVRFKIEFISTDQSNNLYIDNFRIDGAVGIEQLSNNNAWNVSVYPNPSNKENGFIVNYQNSSKDLTMNIIDVLGKSVYTSKNRALGDVSENVTIRTSGMYTILMSDGKTSYQEKIIVY
jgi:PKD repeat protein